MSANIVLQRAQMNVLFIEIEQESSLSKFVENLLKFIELIHLLQSENELYKKEAKDTYYDMLQYCLANYTYFDDNSLEETIRTRANFRPIRFEWFKNVRLDEDLEDIVEDVETLVG